MEEKFQSDFAGGYEMKKLCCLAVILFAVLGCGAALAQSPFDAFIQGREQARRDDWDDAMKAQQLRQMQIQTQEMQRQQVIANNITAFNSTGDYRYLYIASQWGSMQAANFLIQNGVKCFTNSAKRIVCKK